jgi:hypothetical protein
MFANLKANLGKSSKKFHRHVLPVNSLQSLETMIKFLKIKSLLVCEVCSEETNLIILESEQSKIISELFSSIIKNDERRVFFYEKTKECLDRQKLYATVFLIEYKGQKFHILVLAVGPAGRKVTYVSVEEELLFKSALNITGNVR